MQPKNQCTNKTKLITRIRNNVDNHYLKTRALMFQRRSNMPQETEMNTARRQGLDLLTMRTPYLHLQVL